IHSAGLLDLRHELGLGTGPGKIVTSQQQVVTAAHEAHRDPVDIELGAELQVLYILVGKGGQAEVRPGDVDALAVAQGAADDDNGVDDAGLDALDLKRQASVVEQQYVADLDVVTQALVGNPHAFAIARAGVVASERELLAWLQGDLAVSEGADPDLRTLQVLQDADAYAQAGGSRTDGVDRLPVNLARAV